MTADDGRVPGGEAEREALALLRATLDYVDDLSDTESALQGAVATIVRAALARDVPAGRDLTAHDVLEALIRWGFGPKDRRHRERVAEDLNRIARAGDDEPPRPDQWQQDRGAHTIRTRGFPDGFVPPSASLDRPAGGGVTAGQPCEVDHAHNPAYPDTAGQDEPDDPRIPILVEALGDYSWSRRLAPGLLARLDEVAAAPAVDTAGQGEPRPLPYAWGSGDGGRYFPTVEAPAVDTAAPDPLRAPVEAPDEVLRSVVAELEHQRDQAYTDSANFREAFDASIDFVRRHLDGPARDEPQDGVAPSTAEVRAWEVAQYGDNGPERYALKVAEEAGEIAGAVLKRAAGVIKPGRETHAHWTEHLHGEIGDLVISLHALAGHENTDLDALTARRWHGDVSHRHAQLTARPGQGPAQPDQQNGDGRG